MHSSMKSALRKLIVDWTGTDLEVRISSVAGGDTHSNFVAEYVDQTGKQCAVFIKMNVHAHQQVLYSEYCSLLQISRHPTLHYPLPLHYQTDGNYACLILAYHRIKSLDESSGASAGKALAQQHNITANVFGWSAHNHISVTPQCNVEQTSWPAFFRDCRLVPQLELAIANGLEKTSIRSIELICEQAENLLSAREITPCLLHGDLWSGNIGCDRDLSKPIYFDPAPYFGDAEADLAMTHLFGGFPSSFYAAYYAERGGRAVTEQLQAVYNLYHALNHFNLFGYNYQTLVERLIFQTGFVTQLTNSVKLTS